MEDGLERSRHSLNSNNDMYFEAPDEKPIKTLYLCSPVLSDKFELDKCIITDKKEKMQELVNNNYKVTVFLSDVNNNNLYSYSS